MELDLDFVGRIINDRYEIKAKIGEGGTSTVWLAEDIQKNKNVAIKILKKDSTSNKVEDIIRFKNEATTVSELNVSSIVKIFEIGETENITYIIMEYINGSSLQVLLNEGFDFEINTVVEVICELCKALNHIHNNNIIHRDLKPGNVLISFSKSNKNDIPKVKLIDFGLAQIKELKGYDTDKIVGTLSYMSPEQSGIIKKNVDERSDLYSLGIIFYQILTGELPFKGQNINSILHQQIAKVPEPPCKYRPGTPKILDKIILKLLDKEPERRYQSASGLLSDLEKFKKDNTDFMLGLEDKHIKLSYRTNLIGRYNELNKLKTLFNDAFNGNGRICLIGGEAGQGKTRLVEELQDYVCEKNGVYIDCKCFSANNKIPYGPFKDILNIYMRNFNQYSEDMKTSIREFLKVTIGELGEVVIKFNPIMEEILGKCPPLVELEQDMENRRFLMVIAQLMYSLGHIENALVVVINDMQWLDEGSFELLTEITKEIAKHPILIIGTYRNNEIKKMHPLKNYIHTFKRGNYPLFHIFLSSFNLRSMNKFISALLFDTLDDSGEITDFIFQKSKGNPYFAIEILKQLIHDEAIVRKNEQWHVNHDILKTIDVPSTIVDTLIKKISSLQDKEIDVLSYAAIIGKKFNMDLLFTLCDLQKEEIVTLIDNAIELQLVEKTTHTNGYMMFSHDKIKEAFYFNINRQERKKLHLKIARTMETFDTRQTDEYIFDLAYHFIEGGDTGKILEYVFPAALKYKENYANEEALKYFILEANLLEQADQKGSEIWTTCMENIGDIYIIIGKYQEAIEIFNTMQVFVSTTVKKANIYRQISMAYFKKGDWRNCAEYTKEGLELLGEKSLNEDEYDKIHLLIFKELLIKFLHNITPHLFYKFFKTPKNGHYKQIIEFYYILSWLYTFNNTKKSVHSALRMINLASNKSECSKESGLSEAMYANFVLPRISSYKAAIKHHEDTIRLRRDLNDEWGVAQSLQLIGFCYECIGDYKKSIAYHKQSIKIFKKIGDIGEIARSKDGLASVYYYLGDYTNARMINEEYLEIANKTKDIYGMLNSWQKSMQYCIEEGNYEKVDRYATLAFELSTDIKNTVDICLTNGLLGILAMERKEIKKAVEYLEKAKITYDENNFSKQNTVFVYYQLADAYILEYSYKRGRFTKKQSAAFVNKINKICNLALKKTKNCITHRIGAIRVTAKYYALTRNWQKSEKLFLESIALAQHMDRKFEIGKGYYEYGMFLERQERIEDSKDSLRIAYNIFKDIGAKGYEKRIADILGIVETGTSYVERLTNELRHTQRLSSIITLSQDLSSILDLNVLLEKVMLAAIQVVGAQKGYLIMKDDKNGDIKVMAKMNINENELGTDDFSKNIVVKVLESEQAVLTTNAMEDEKYFNYQSVLYNELKSILCIPIKYTNELKGVCYLSNPLSSGVFTDKDADILNAIMTQAAISIENAKLYKLAITDGLTELMTHKHFKFLLKNEIDDSFKNNKVFSLILFDIDHFKKFNDMYGHQAGDEVLKNVSRIVREEFRSMDILARYGGEEFAIILPETDMSGAGIVAERLRKAIQNTCVVFNGNKLKVTISIGVAVYPHHGINAETLIRMADTAMYLSKQNGRNQVTVMEYAQVAGVKSI